jgi:phosphopantetheinyl transferase
MIIGHAFPIRFRVPSERHGEQRIDRMARAWMADGPMIEIVQGRFAPGCRTRIYEGISTMAKLSPNRSTFPTGRRGRPVILDRRRPQDG